MALETIVVSDDSIYDIIVLGAGPAGLTAGMYGAQSGLKTLIIEKSTPGGKLPSINEIHNFPGYDTIKGEKLATILYNQAKNAKCNFLFSEVIKLEKKMSYWVAYCNNRKTLYAKAIVVCTGVGIAKLNITNEEKYSGMGISYCVNCDGMLTKNKIVYVVGDDQEAFNSCLYLSSIAKTVNLLVTKSESEYTQDLELLKTKKVNVLFNSQVKKIDGDMWKLNKIQIFNTKDNEMNEYNCDFLFIVNGTTACSEFIQNEIMIDRENENIIKVIDNNKTVEEGIFAAGDVIKTKNRQIITAINDAIVAINSAITYVNNIKNGKN